MKEIHYIDLVRKQGFFPKRREGCRTSDTNWQSVPDVWTLKQNSKMLDVRSAEVRTVIGGGSGVVLIKNTTSGDETEKRKG